MEAAKQILTGSEALLDKLVLDELWVVDDWRILAGAESIPKSPPLSLTDLIDAVTSHLPLSSSATSTSQTQPVVSMAPQQASSPPSHSQLIPSIPALMPVAAALQQQIGGNSTGFLNFTKSAMYTNAAPGSVGQIPAVAATFAMKNGNILWHTCFICLQGS